MDQIYDIVVIGAGPSGVAAAAYAAKFGAKTAIFEKNSIVGGTALKANASTLRGGSLSSMDGLLDGITKKAWNSMIFQPEELLDKYYALLQKYGVSIFCGYTAISIKSDDKNISSIVFSTGTGKTSITAKIIIDATGIQEVENLTGTKDTGYAQYCYMSALIGKVETVGGKCYSKEAKELIKEKISYSKSTGQFSADLFVEIQPTVRADIALLVIKYEGSENIDGAFMRKRMNEAIIFLQDFGYGFENASLIVSSKDIFYSAQGASSAKYTLSLEEITKNKYFSDQVAALPDDDGDDDRVYYIPYGSILSAKFDNLLLCGRNIGATTNAMDQIDSIPTHFETGKAAGIAAAIATKIDIPLDGVSSYEIISKSQDSVTKKIEILNEIVGEEETIPPIVLNIIEDTDEEIQSVPLKYMPDEKEDSDGFESLDAALSLINEDISEDKNNPEDYIEHTEDVKEFISDIDLVMDIDKESIVKKIEPEPESAKSIISKMAGFTSAIDVFTPEISENEVSEDLIEDLIIESFENDKPESDIELASKEDKPLILDPSDILSEIFNKNKDVLNLETEQDTPEELEPELTLEATIKPLQENISEQDDVTDTVNSDALEKAQEDIKDINQEETSKIDNENIVVEKSHQEDPVRKSNQDAKVSLSDFVFSSIATDPELEDMQENISEPTQDDVVIPTPEDTSVPSLDDVVTPTLEDTSVPSLDDVVTPTLEDISEPTLDDVVTPTLEDASVPAQEVVVTPIQDALSIEEPPKKEKTLAEELETPKDIVSNDDVLSLLYKQNDQDSSNKETTHTPVENIAQDELSLLYDSGAVKPKTSKKGPRSNDKTATMLDMIYEITDNNEDKIHTQEHSDLPNQWISNAPQDGETKSPIRDDKFKSIKDFLYDNDID